jgi:hypothetical protein
VSQSAPSPVGWCDGANVVGEGADQSTRGRVRSPVLWSLVVPFVAFCSKQSIRRSVGSGEIMPHLGTFRFKGGSENGQASIFNGARICPLLDLTHPPDLNSGA